MDYPIDRHSHAVHHDTEQQRVTPALFWCSAGAALGGLLFGADTAVISGATTGLQAHFALGNAALGFTVASALIGTVIGSLIAGAPSDRYGRRAMLVAVAICYLVSAIGSGMGLTWPMLIGFRMLGGLAIGAASVVTPIYIAEVAPARFRGRLVMLNQFNIVLGILLAFLSNYAIAQIVPVPAQAWRWMLGIVAVPSLAFLLVTGWLPESPRWLIVKGRTQQGIAVMKRLGFPNPVHEADRIIRSLGEAAHSASPKLFQARYFTPVTCAITIAVFNQCSGVNALLFYAPRVFELAGAGAGGAMLNSVVIGGTNLAATMTAVFLIDRFGRKPLLYVGSLVCAVSLVVIGTQLGQAHPNGPLVLGSFMTFIAGFAGSQGAVIWVFISEVFPSEVRGKGQALGSTTHWVVAAAVTWIFPVVASAAGGAIFYVFGGVMLLQFVWTWKVMPETNGIALEDMELVQG